MSSRSARGHAVEQPAELRGVELMEALDEVERGRGGAPRGRGAGRRDRRGERRSPVRRADRRGRSWSTGRCRDARTRSDICTSRSFASSIRILACDIVTSMPRNSGTWICSIRLRNSSKTSSTCSTLPSGVLLLVGHRQILCHSRSIRARRTFREQQNLTAPGTPYDVRSRRCPTSADRRGGRPALSRAPSLPGAAALAASGRGGRPLRVRAVGLGPVRSDRRGGPQPRPRPALTRRGLPAREDRRLLYEERSVYETYNKGLSLVPTAELPWYRVTWDRAHEAPRRHVRRARAARRGAPRADPRGGPLSATDVEPRATIDWYWRPTNQVRAILEALAEAGILGIARRDGNRRVYDLAERLFPAELLAERLPPDDQQRHNCCDGTGRTASSGAGGQAELWFGTARRATDRERRGDAELVASASADAGRRSRACGRPRYLPGDELDDAGRRRRPRSAARAARPRRARRGVPRRRSTRSSGTGRCCATCSGSTTSGRSTCRSAKRRWGYYVLPILFGDRLVGRIEPRIERRENRLRVVGLWFEDGFDPLAEPAFVPAFAAALRAHAEFGGVDRIVLPRHARHRPVVGAVSRLLGRVGGSAAELRQRLTLTVSQLLQLPALSRDRTRNSLSVPGYQRTVLDVEVVVAAIDFHVPPLGAPLDLEVAEAGREDLQATVGAGPANLDRDVAAAEVASRRPRSGPRAPCGPGPFRKTPVQ